MGERRGYVSGFGAYVMWGFFPIYFHHLLPAGPTEILAHRVIWSVVCVAVITTGLRRWQRIADLRHRPKTLAGVALAATLIAINWFVYIYGVNTNQVIETSLGYFINPLISVLFGVMIFKERLRRAQWVAIGLGGLAVAVIAIDYGRLPWIALTLAVSFGSYGLVKKRLGLPPTDGLLVESSVLALPALAYLTVLTAQGRSTFTSVSTLHTILLIAAGLATAAAAAAVRRRREPDPDDEPRHAAVRGADPATALGCLHLPRDDATSRARGLLPGVDRADRLHMGRGPARAAESHRRTGHHPGSGPHGTAGDRSGQVVDEQRFSVSAAQFDPGHLVETPRRVADALDRGARAGGPRAHLLGRGTVARVDEELELMRARVRRSGRDGPVLALHLDLGAATATGDRRERRPAR